MTTDINIHSNYRDVQGIGPCNVRPVLGEQMGLAELLLQRNTCASLMLVILSGG